MNIEIRVYNRDLELLGIIDEFSSLIWIRRYQAPGEFELHTPYSDESRSLLASGNVIQKFDGRTSLEAGVVEYIQMNYNEITIKGRFWEAYFDNRTEYGFYNGNLEDSLRGIISAYVNSDESSLPPLALGTDHGLTETLEFQSTMKTTLSVVSRACRARALGFRTRPDFTARKMYFEVYKGADRASDSSSKVIFSETYDNMTNEVYTFDNTNFKTRAYITQLVDGSRWTATYDPYYYEGLDRRMLPVQSAVETDGKTYDEIVDAMKLEGKNALNNHVIAESFTFSTDPDGTFKYRDDYDLGDQVIINHISWGINRTIRITEIEENYSENASNIILTCGSPLPETIDFKEGY